MCVIFLITFIFGSVIGSFINVIVDRTDTKDSPFKGRSFCPYCRKTLAWWEMVPIINFFYLKGRCSNCHHKLSWQYPLIEFITGFLFALVSWRFLRFPLLNLHIIFTWQLETILFWINFIFWLYWIFVLITISLYDLKKYLILSEVLFPAIILSLIWKIILGIFFKTHNFTYLTQINHILGAQSYVFGSYPYFLSLILGVIVSFGLIALLAFVTKERAMGWGDALVAIFIGLILGWPEAIMALIIAFLSGGLISIVLMLLKKKTIKSYLPFAPFLAFGALLILLFGDIIIKGYLSLLIL